MSSAQFQAAPQRQPQPDHRLHRGKFILWTVIASVAAMLCLWLGIAIGALSHILTGALTPSLDHLALPAVVFLVAIVIVGLRTHSVLGNMLSWFLGMVTYFAAELDFAVASFMHLAIATGIGGLAGYTCQALNRRFAE
ncbi:DUF1097 domain-containing protein [Rhizobium leguminosarum]|uniref:DUF1097 domain-containing protein n=1 Tax=Rhizobium leguminosarum TaxID=384 RepID=UPI0003788748|nr:DUF1097 domain-containing protein [Rhizobium leguminosarum]